MSTFTTTFKPNVGKYINIPYMDGMGRKPRHSRHFSVNGFNFNRFFRYSDSAKVRFLSPNETQPKQHFRLEGSWGTIFKSSSKKWKLVVLQKRPEMHLPILANLFGGNSWKFIRIPDSGWGNRHIAKPIFLDHGFPDQFFGSISRPLGFLPVGVLVPKLALLWWLCEADGAYNDGG